MTVVTVVTGVTVVTVVTVMTAVTTLTSATMCIYVAVYHIIMNFMSCSTPDIRFLNM